MNNIVFDHTLIGGGVIGFNVTHDLVNKIINNKTLKNKIFNFLIIDKKINNLIGGVAYNLELSSYGYFNNPIRLSPKAFVDYIKKNKKFQFEILSHFKKNSGFIDKIWIRKSFNILKKPNSKAFKELYLPRASFGIWQRFRLIELFKVIDNFNLKNKQNVIINLCLGEGEIINIKNYKFKTQIISSKNFVEVFKAKYNLKKNDVVFEKTTQKFQEIKCTYSTLGLGLNPPKKYYNEKFFYNKNYIWDFYAEGSTKNLIKKIKNIAQEKNKRKKINLFFIGYKAGLLECLPELNQLIKKKHVNIKIAAVSLSLETLQKAEFVKNKSYKFGILNNHKIKNVNKAFQIVKLVEEEFDYAENSGFNKYHAWTNVLSKNVLSKMISQLSNNEKTKYDTKYFTRLRNITRFTYPYPLEIKDKMLKENSLRLIKDKVLSIKSFSNYILIKTLNKNYKADVVVNVSGPLQMNRLSNELLLVKNLKEQKLKFDNLGFKVQKHFETGKNKNIYIPGTLASGFNPHRITILDAILQNSSQSANNIYSKILTSKHKKIIFNCYKNKVCDLRKTNITKGGITCSKELFENIVANNLKKINIISNPSFKIVIDGKAGSGKSTLGRILSDLFDTILIDTGFILKALSFKLNEDGINKKNIENINIRKSLNILNDINLNDLTNVKLENKKLRPITMYLAKNEIIRRCFNKKIFEFSKMFNSFILTGRDTGTKVFLTQNKVFKFYMKVADHIAVKRKSSINSDLKTNYFETLQRINADKKRTLINSKSIILNNNKDLKFTINNALKNLIL